MGKPKRGKQSKGGGPGVLSRVMDLMSRPNYAMANSVHEMAKLDDVKMGARGPGLRPGDPRAELKGFWEGLSGKKKITWSDNFTDSGLIKNPVASAALGFGFDIATDPTTFLTAGLGKIPTAAKAVEEEAEVATKGSKAANVARAAKSAAETEKIVQSGESVSKAKRAAEALRAADDALKAAPPVGKVSKAVAEGAKTAETVEKTQKVKKAVKSAEELVSELEKLEPVKVTRLTTEGKKATRGFEASLRAADDAIEAAKAAKSGTEAVRSITQAIRASEKTLVAANTAGKVAGTAINAGTAAKALDTTVDTARTVERTSKAASLAAQGGADGAAPRIVAAASKAPEAAQDARALQLKLLGKPVVSSTKAYDLLAKAGRPVASSPVGELVSKTLRTGHGMPEKIHNMRLQSSGRARLTVADKAHTFHEAYKGISKSDQKRILDAIQTGSVDTLPQELKATAEFTQSELLELYRMSGKKIPEIEKAIQAAKDAGKTLGDDELQRFVKFEDNYLYKGARHPIDRAPQAFIAQYDKEIRKVAFIDFMNDVKRRFPQDASKPEIRDALDTASKLFGTSGEVSSVWQHYMAAMVAPWKRWVTAYRPGFHVRNMLGDSFNAFLAGTRPERFSDSARILKYARSDDHYVTLAGKKYTTAQIDQYYRRGGLETSFIETEVVGGSQGRLGRGITHMGEQREKFVRMATFTDSMHKELKNGRSLERAIEESAAKVRKYHFDYTDLTPAERKLRQFLPFYTYTRKELPLLLEHTLFTPGKIVGVQKGTNTLSQMLGVQHDPDDPFPGIEGIVPSYLKDQSMIQRGNNKVFTPGLPTDYLSWLNPGEAVKGVASQLTPAIKTPLELATGKSFPEGFPIFPKGKSQEEGMARYLASMGPYGNMFRDSKSSIMERLFNLLTGAGSRTVR